METYLGVLGDLGLDKTLLHVQDRVRLLKKLQTSKQLKNYSEIH